MITEQERRDEVDRWLQYATDDAHELEDDLLTAIAAAEREHDTENLRFALARLVADMHDIRARIGELR